MNIEPDKILDVINEINKNTSNFKDYILQCFDLYKSFDNESWRKEFEDVHSIEFYAGGFIYVRAGLPFNSRYDEKIIKEISDEKKKEITQYYFDMAKVLLESRNLDNIYLLSRICAFNGLPGFYESYEEQEKAKNEINSIHAIIFSDPEMKEKAKNYNPKNKE